MTTVPRNHSASRCLLASVATLAVLLTCAVQASAAETAAAAASAGKVPAAWRCSSCAAGAGWSLDLGLAPAYVADDAYRFGDYTGLDEKGAYLFGDFSGVYRGAGTGYFNFDGFTLSPDFSALFLEGGRQGSYELRGSYQSIPRRFYDATLTPYLGVGTESLTLPADWVRAPTTGAMSGLDGALQPLEVKRDWNIFRLGFDIMPNSRWTIRSDYRRLERKGQNLHSGSFLFNAAEFVKPVDHSTDDLTLAVEFAADTWQASMSYLGSYFENGNDRLSWENPYSGLPGADAGTIAQAPDNESHQLVLAGAMRLPKRTVLSGQLAFGTLSQDEDLLPYTTNPLLTTGPLPTASAAADADTFNLNLRGVTSPWRPITLEAEVRYHEFDNRTPVSIYDYVITDSVAAEVPVTNLAYDYERSELKLRGEYRASRNLKLHLGFDTRTFKRNFQDRSRTTTDRLWFRLRHRLGPGADVDFDLFSEARRGSSYDVLENPAAQQNPLMRKYNLSDRDRYGFRLRGSLYPAERWDLGWEFEYGEDEYDATAIGLTRSKYARAGLDMSLLIGREGSFYASINTEQIEAVQASSQSFTRPDWAATTMDRFDSASIGLEHPELVGPVGFSIGYDWSRGRGETASNTSGLASAFPDLRSQRQTLRLGFDYRLDDNWRFGLNYVHEKVRTDDWAISEVAPVTVPNLLAVGADPFNYAVNVIYFSVRLLR